MSESSFGPNAGVERRQEPSYAADVAAGYDDDEGPGSDADRYETADDSSTADVAAGYEDDDEDKDE